MNIELEHHQRAWMGQDENNEAILSETDCEDSCLRCAQEKVLRQVVEGLRIKSASFDGVDPEDTFYAGQSMMLDELIRDIEEALK